MDIQRLFHSSCEIKNLAEEEETQLSLKQIKEESTCIIPNELDAQTVMI